MLPTLLPSLAAAIVVFALSQLGVRPSPRRARTTPGRLYPTKHHTNSSKLLSGRNLSPVPDGDLDFRLRRHLGSFELDVAWKTSARRLAILGPSGSGKTLTLRLLA